MEIFGLLDALDVVLKKKAVGSEVSTKDLHRCLKDVLNCPEISSPLDGIANTSMFLSPSSPSPFSSPSPSPSTSSQQRETLLSTWAEVFHQRLAGGGTEVLSTAKRESYVKALSDYLDSVNRKTTLRRPTTTTTSMSLPSNRNTNNNNKAAITTELERKKSTLHSATTLLDYLQTHQQDLHNCLIGLRPSQFVEANSCWPLLNSTTSSSSKTPSSSTSPTSLSSLSSTASARTIMTSSSPSPSPSLPSSSSSSSSSPLLAWSALNSTNNHLQKQQQSTHHQPSELTLEGFVQQILTWSELHDKDQLFLEVRTLAESLRVRQLFSPGDLVIASLPPPPSSASSFSSSASASPSSSSLEVEGWCLVYGRVVKQVERVVMVNTDPTERATPKAVAVERVIEFPKSLKDCLGGVQKMKLLVEDTIDVLFSELSHYINTAVLKIVSGEQPLLQRISKKKITFEDAEIVKKALEGLESMKKRLEEINDVGGDGDKTQEQHSQAQLLPLYQEIEAHVKTRIKEFKKTVNVDSLFVVTKANFREVLRGIDTLQLVLSFINAHAEECNSALRALELQRQALRSGSRKRRLKEWWLNYIRTAVVAFLEERDFDFGAMSEHYIDKPPRNVEGVRANLHLVREILNFFETNDRHSLLAWLKQLITHIYSKFSSFFVFVFVLFLFVFVACAYLLIIDS
jgi:hypothetical protein